MTLTMMPYLDKLKPVQQDYIVWCVREFSLKPYGPDFHRGLLPFLAAEEAAFCLRCRKFQLTGDAALSINPLIGTRFISSILDVFQGDMHAVETGTSQAIYLNDAKLHKAYRRRYSAKFMAKLYNLNNELVQLERISKNYWKVTAPSAVLPKALTSLSDQYA